MEMGHGGRWWLMWWLVWALGVRGSGMNMGMKVSVECMSTDAGVDRLMQICSQTDPWLLRY